MKILKANQYNQGVGKYKLLSSTAGVGSIITTKVGSYVLISDINKWKFIIWVNSKIGHFRDTHSDERRVYELSNKEITARGIDFIDDKRFVNFIKTEKNLDNLICLIGIPHMALNENYNTPNWKHHPIKTALDKIGETGISSDYMIIGTHFPKWFINRKRKLKKISEWKEMWEKEGRKNRGSPTKSDFAPPRDASDFIKEFKQKDFEGREILYREYRELNQTNLTLICPNGHLSDIPWEKFLTWKTLKETHQLNREDNGENLFNIEPCCNKPDLIWTESKTKSEGYGSIYIECKKCGLGSGESKEKPKINLGGINNLQPKCKGQKPWEISSTDSEIIPFERCFVGGDKKNGHEKMQISLVTANNIYYANGFSSLFIPLHLADGKSVELIKALSTLEARHKQSVENANKTGRPVRTKEEYFEKLNLEFFIYDEEGLNPDNLEQFTNELKNSFLDNNQENIDSHEEYRWQEYKTFSQNTKIEEEGLSFQDVILPSLLTDFFYKIQQVDELKVTNVQFDFTRVKPKERIVKINDDGERVVEDSSIGQNIFSIPKEELFVLPANETFGEGLFFQLNDHMIDKWIKENKEELSKRYNIYTERDEIKPDEQFSGIKQKIKNNGIKHFLIHSFSHLMMRELEFSCGYPTASLKERLYISNTPEKTMSGVLIYTAEGSEGSMGGLVSQGEPEKISEIIIKGLERSINCSSDPLCWETDGQGIFDLNLSACFSCSLVSETACEEMNLGLDRRVLVDEQFGYFKNLINI